MSKEPAVVRRQGRGSRAYTVAFGAFVALIGLVFCVWLVSGYLRVRETYDWNETLCVITDSSIETSRFSKHSPVSYDLKVSYRFEVDGVERTSRSIRRREGAKRKTDRAEVEKAARKYAAGTEHTCYVNPEDPAVAVLEHDSKAVGYAIWFPGLFVVGGVGIMIAAWRRK